MRKSILIQSLLSFLCLFGKQHLLETFLIVIIRNLLTVYRKYCNLIGYRTYYLSRDR